ncbi:MAG: phytanoyl-CoA dioxygenase family protein, partial [Rhodospirillales bacterium]|nr:phytanoyl-CoA dioxygenase family protein [Rhodospirillales bacterium]
NRTNRARTGLAFGYSLGWLRQVENQFLTYPPKIARAFPENLQELIGYTIQRPNLGWYEGQDPRVALLEDDGGALATKDYLSPETEALLQILSDAA